MSNSILELGEFIIINNNNNNNNKIIHKKKVVGLRSAINHRTRQRRIDRHFDGAASRRRDALSSIE